MDGSPLARVEPVVKLKDTHNIMAKKSAVVGTVKTPKVKDAILAHVSKDGAFIRTYSLEVHGENFADLAREFASKVEGRKVELK